MGRRPCAYRAPGSISCVDREIYFLFIGVACAEPSSSDEWSGVSNGAVLADGRGKLLHYFGHVVDSSIVKTWESCRSNSTCFRNGSAALLSAVMW